MLPSGGETADHGPGLSHSVNLQSQRKMVSNFVHALSGLIVLENVRPLDGLPLSVMFDGRMWLGLRHVLTSIFCYYNSSNDYFLDIGH